MTFDHIYFERYETKASSNQDEQNLEVHSNPPNAFCLQPVRYWCPETAEVWAQVSALQC
jgi:hypothetical protein